jgi:hypothetical protein
MNRPATTCMVTGVSLWGMAIDAAPQASIAQSAPLLGTSQRGSVSH